MRPSESTPDYPKALEDVCLRALARRPADRYATATDMRRDLLRVARELGDSPLPEEELGRLMTRLFEERIEEKREMLRRVRAGSNVTRVPDAEIDVNVELPVAEKTSALPSTARDVARPRAPTPFARRPWTRMAFGGVGILALATVWFAGRSSTSISTQTSSVSSSLATAPPSSASAADASVPAPSSSVESPSSREVVLHLETTPAGARVLVAGQDRGITPVDLRLPRAATSLELELRKDGYAPLKQAITPDVDQRLVLTLTARSKPRAAATADDGYHRFQ